MGPPRPAVPTSRAEYAADAAVHIIGLTAAAIACLGLVLAVPSLEGRRLPLALGLYAAGLLAMLGCSALYNLAGAGRRLRSVDHGQDLGPAGPFRLDGQHQTRACLKKSRLRWLARAASGPSKCSPP